MKCNIVRCKNRAKYIYCEGIHSDIYCFHHFGYYLVTALLDRALKRDEEDR